MKITVARSTLVNTVTWVARIIPARPTHPVLAGITIETVGQQVKFGAFDYDTAATQTMPAIIEQHGRVLVSGRLLADLVKALPGTEVLLEVQENTLLLVSGKSKFKLALMPVEEYPALPKLPPNIGSLTRDELTTAVQQTTISIAKDLAQPALAAVNVTIGEELVFTSTDRYRLGVKKVRWFPAENLPPKTNLTVSAKALTDAIRHSGGEDIVELHANEHTIGFQSGTALLLTTLVDGDYPDVLRLIPNETPTVVTVNSGELLDAVGRLTLVTDQHQPVTLSFSNGEVSLQAGSESSSGREVVDAQIVGPDIEVRLNPQFLSSALSVLSGTKARLGFTLGHKPVLFNGVNDEDEVDDSFQHLVVPVRTLN